MTEETNEEGLVAHECYVYDVILDGGMVRRHHHTLSLQDVLHAILACKVESEQKEQPLMFRWLSGATFIDAIIDVSYASAEFDEDGGEEEDDDEEEERQAIKAPTLAGGRK